MVGPSKAPASVRLLLRLLVREEEREFLLGDLMESGRRSWIREILGLVSLRPSRVPRGPAPHPGGGSSLASDLGADLRHALRSLGRSPGFTVVVILTMALGIGANTAVFSVLSGVVLRPLPFPEPAEIVVLTESNLAQGWTSFRVSPLNYWDWRERSRSMAHLAAYQEATVAFAADERPESLAAFRVSEDFLEILGGAPSLGRGLTDADLVPGAEAVAVLSHGLWERAFGGDPGALGRVVSLDGAPHRVVGILQEGFDGLPGREVDLLLPLVAQPYWHTSRGSHHLVALGRLRPGTTVEQARAEFSSIAAALAAEYPDTNEGWGAVVRPLDEVVRGEVRPQILVFMACVALILLIACANLANMMLARANSRGREIAVRATLGAGRGRIVRHLLAESILLSVAGGALGVGLAFLGVGALRSGWPDLLPGMESVRVDGTVLLFALALAIGSGLLFGLAPALRGVGGSLQESLRRGGRGVVGHGARRLRGGLVTAEVSLAVVLLVGTGLLLRSLAALTDEDPGFRSEGRVVVVNSLAPGRYGTGEAVRVWGTRVLERLEGIPGVEAAALASMVPLEGSDNIWGYWVAAGPLDPAHSDGSAHLYRVSARYFEVMGIPLQAGRGFTQGDRKGAPPVAMVSASLAARHFPGESPVGRSLRFDPEDESSVAEIVGVVGDVQHGELGEVPEPQIYVPFAQRPSLAANLVLTVSAPGAEVTSAVLAALAAVDPTQPVRSIESARAMVSDSIATPRFRTLLMAGFGLTALLLAVVGLYGVMAYSVSQRTKEIGVRMALGASRGSVLGMVFREGAPLVGVGLGVGLAGAFALSRVLESMLFGVGARDVAVFTAVPLVLVAVAAAALLVPARRATRVDPVRTLGEE